MTRDNTSTIRPSAAVYEHIRQAVPAILESANIPGAAISIVIGDETVFAAGFGLRDKVQPMTADTAYPIGSTTKALNATLLGMLVEEKLLDWDAPVRDFLPGFRLRDPDADASIRDLITMRTGLPRHDWLWLYRDIARTELVAALPHLQMIHPFRERFHYNNLTIAVAGHIAEIVSGESWEALVCRRILVPLGMRDSACSRPSVGPVTRSYYEVPDGRLAESRPCLSHALSPAGALIHSTVQDMARWLVFNLSAGACEGKPLINPATLAEIHHPHIPTQGNSPAPSANAHYAMGWFVDEYSGHKRISHGGYCEDVESAVLLYPTSGVGIAITTNFGPPRLARPIADHIFDILVERPSGTMGRSQAKLAEYQRSIAETRRAYAATPRISDKRPARSLDEYAGSYAHPAYGEIVIRHGEAKLFLERGTLHLPLEHWHYEAWVSADRDAFPINERHPFDPVSPLNFHVSRDGKVSHLSVAMQASLPPIEFEKQGRTPAS